RLEVICKYQDRGNPSQTDHGQAQHPHGCRSHKIRHSRRLDLIGVVVSRVIATKRYPVFRSLPRELTKGSGPPNEWLEPIAEVRPVCRILAPMREKNIALAID